MREEGKFSSLIPALYLHPGVLSLINMHSGRSRTVIEYGGEEKRENEDTVVIFAAPLSLHMQSAPLFLSPLTHFPLPDSCLFDRLGSLIYRLCGERLRLVED